MNSEKRIASRTTRWGLLAVISGLALLTLGAAHLAGNRRVSVDGLEPSSALTVCFVNFGNPKEELGTLIPSNDPVAPFLTSYWKEEATLERVLLEVLADAEARGLDGKSRIDSRRGALDIIFASNHSLRVAEPGPEGEVVGRIVVDRTRPSEARAGMLSVMDRLAQEHAGEFPNVRIYNFFLLNCGSWEDTADHALLQRAAVALTGSPPAHILTTSGKVVPDPRHVQAGYATGLPITLYDSIPGEQGPITREFLRLAKGGVFNFITGAGQGIERLPVVTLKLPEDPGVDPSHEVK